MSSNIEIVNAVLDAFGRGDIPALLNMCTENVEVMFMGDPYILPFAGEWKGKNRVTDYFRVIGETVDVLKWQPEKVVASGNSVAAFYATDLRVKASGKTAVNNRMVLHFTVDDAKVTGWQVYADTAALEKAFAAHLKASV